MKAYILFRNLLITTCIACFAASCSKDESVQATGEARVNVVLGAVQEQQSTMKMASAAGTTLSQVQQTTVPFTDAYTLVATLASTSSATLSQKVSTAGGNTAAATTTTTILEQGVQYRVVVYDAAGNYLSNQVFTVGNTTNAAMAFNAGQRYTFIAYSINSKTSVPDVDPQQNLAAATLSSLSGSTDLLYFRSDITLNGGDNNLNVVLKHLFSQITTTINAAAIGTIESCSASIAPHYLTVGVKLGNAQISYTGNTGSASLAFTGFQTSQISSAATILNHPSTAAGVLTIASIKAGGITRTGLKLENLSITPGVKYTLNLELKPNFGISLGGYTWAPGNLVYNNGNYGFAEDQGKYGDQWQVNALLPIDRGAGSEGQQAYDAAKDPCRMVTSHGGNWRTPTVTHLQAATGANRNEKPIFHVRYDLPGQPRASYRGVAGLFVGTTTQPAEADVDKYLFLPYAGERNWGQGSMGTYWTVTPSSANNERFQFNTGDVTWPYSSQYYNAGGSIRCVKAQ
ncbi:fimbrillin family protein [Sphingobacterium griseoflavum]|uniref:Fibrobacter succinogenes major paralogous domain-containing protein n=1 Tax=Sphingobacterium griseoflavum TaxID=1474952 RepID=A0ABQ3HVV7_9SPHI|nr:fimbrillin family protein [Sphingobacterium griseoflavum]GHE39700.1 hypothetical protein GCM10017764_23730 [Sphingobacterium griseoflavum]